MANEGAGPDAAFRGHLQDGRFIALCHGNGGTLSSQVTAIFGTAATL